MANNKQHFAQFLFAGRPITNQIDSILSLGRQIERKKLEIEALQNQIKWAESDLLDDLKTVFTDDEIDQSRKDFEEYQKANEHLLETFIKA